MGNMGSSHAASMHRIRDCELSAVCDIVPSKLDRYPDLQKFEDSAEMIRSGVVDAVLIATPHYDHTTIGIDAMQNGLHVLVEKPISVHKADCRRLIAAHSDPKIVFAAMFNQRTDPHYKRLRKLVQSGELGEIRRTNWIATQWLRTEAYYASGGWRATWRGEGGGVLMNQCPHNLDLFQWICGMPISVRAFCSFGKYHSIEVEDEVTAYLEYPNGATGVFVTTTAEGPGTNRLEIAGDRGKVVYEDGKIRFTRTERSVKDVVDSSPDSFPSLEVWDCELPVQGWGGQHQEIVQNFVDAIERGEPLVAPAEEGIRSVELANSMLYSTFTNSTVNLPLDENAYEAVLKQKIAESNVQKTVRDQAPVDLANSFK